jgi:hypothetical protein
MAGSDRYLTVRILYPGAGHTDDVLSAIGRVAAAARRFDGLVEIGAWQDSGDDRIVNISLWGVQGTRSQCHGEHA